MNRPGGRGWSGSERSGCGLGDVGKERGTTWRVAKLFGSSGLTASNGTETKLKLRWGQFSGVGRKLLGVPRSIIRNCWRFEAKLKFARSELASIFLGRMRGVSLRQFKRIGRHRVIVSSTASVFLKSWNGSDRWRSRSADISWLGCGGNICWSSSCRRITGLVRWLVGWLVCAGRISRLVWGGGR